MTSGLTQSQADSLSEVGLDGLSMQPTFHVSLALDADTVMRRIRDAIQAQEFRQQVKSASRCVDFTIAQQDQRFWSPHLSVQISDTDSGSVIFGRFSPRPEIWTMFMAIYSFMALVVFGAAIYGYAQWALQSQPWALVLMPVGILVIGLLHIASLIGQRLSSDQIRLLLERFRSVLQTALEESPAV